MDSLVDYNSIGITSTTSLFDINNLTFNNKKITIVLDDNNNPWFCGNEIAELLGYSRGRKAINQHIKEKYIKNFENICLYQNVIHPPQNGAGEFIKKKTKFINEFGLYELIMKSKLPVAEKFQDWVFEEVLPSIRKQGEYKLNKQLQEINKQLQLKNDEIQQTKIQVSVLEDKISSISASNKCLKNFVDNVKTKNKSSYIYIATSKNYANQNIFKVGKTDNLKNRLSSYNTNRTLNDKFYYCYFEKVYNANKVESIIIDLLEDFKDKKEKEIIILHYKYLLELIQLTIKNINEPYDYLNKLIKNKLASMYDLKPIIPQEINIENIEFIEHKNKIIKLLDECIESNNLSLTRKELIDKLELTEINKLDLWNNVKSLLNWTNSKTPIMYKNKLLYLTYN